MDIDSAYRRLVETGRLCPDAGQKQAVDALKSLAASLADPPRRSLASFFRSGRPPRGVYLWGPVGSGKSMLMDLFLDQLGDIPGKRTHFHDFMAQFHAVRHRNPALQTDRAARRITGPVRVLCFDEFTITHIADAMVIKRVFEAIFASGIPVVATSNQTPEDLYRGGLNAERFEPFIPVLHDRMTVIGVTSMRDYRRGAKISLWYCGDDADDALTRLWREKTHGQPSQPSDMHVSGRRLSIPMSAGGYVRFPLEALCGQPLGASDYLALAGRFHIFFISGVPIFTRRHSAVTARLRVLIDVLYDRRCALAVAAEADPDEIFRNCDPSFARTASRLNEMCSLDYLEATENMARQRR